MVQAREVLIKTIEGLLEESELELAVDALLLLEEKTKAGFRQDVILHSGNYLEAQKMFKNNLIDFDNYSRKASLARFGLLDVVKDLGKKLASAKNTGLQAFQYVLPDVTDLDHALGSKSPVDRFQFILKLDTLSASLVRILSPSGKNGIGLLNSDHQLTTASKILDAQANAGFSYTCDPDGNAVFADLIETKGAIQTDQPGSQLSQTQLNGSVPSLSGNEVFEWAEYQDKNQPGFLICYPEDAAGLLYIATAQLGENKDNHIDFKLNGTVKPGLGAILTNAKLEAIGILTEELESKNKSHGTALVGATKPVVEKDKPSPEPLAPPDPKPTSGIPKFVFVYDELDKQLSDRLNNHLFVLRNTKKIEVYSIHRAKAGEDVEARAREELKTADYLVCLISPNLFNEEAPWFGIIMEELAAGKPIIPVLLQKMDIAGTGLEKLKALPPGNLSIAEYANQDAAYAAVAKEIGRLVGN
ncbi:MAG: hypothetical protein R2792_04975 [Saprospiraceae bacterium]